jgi:hypothetical protein
MSTNNLAEELLKRIKTDNAMALAVYVRAHGQEILHILKASVPVLPAPQPEGDAKKLLREWWDHHFDLTVGGWDAEFSEKVRKALGISPIVIVNEFPHSIQPFPAPRDESSGTANPETPVSSVQNLALLIGVCRYRLNDTQLACVCDSLRCLADAAGVDNKVTAQALK